MIALAGSNGAYNPNGHWWQFRNPNKPDYSPTVEGTIVQIEEKQATQYNGHQNVYKYKRNGQPKMAARLTIASAATGQDELFEFETTSPNSEFVKAIKAAMPECNDVEQLAGKVVRITSPDGRYDMNNPRPFILEILADKGPVPYRGTIHFDPSQLVQQSPQQAPPMMGGMYAAPSPAPYQGYQTQPQQQYRPQYQTGYQTQQQPQYQQQPQQQQPVQQQQYQQPQMQQPYQAQPASAYDEDISF